MCVGVSRRERCSFIHSVGIVKVLTEGCIDLGRRDGRVYVPEHSSARDLPDPVGDSSSAFSPASAALSTLPMTP